MNVSGADDRYSPDGKRWISAICLGTGAVAALLALLVHGSLIDDAYITLSYARNLAFHFHWGLIRQTTANSATSPLNVLVLGAGMLVFRSAAWAVAVVYVGSNVAFAWWVTRAVRFLDLPWITAVLAIGLVLLNPLMLSVVGMETTTLAVAVLAALLFYALEGRPAAFGIVAGLALLTRLDLVIFVLVLGLSSRTLRHNLRAVLVPLVLVSGPWFIFSWFQLGSAIPDTYVIKTLQSWSNSFGSGLLFYARRVPVAVALSAATAIAGAATIALWSVLRMTRRWRSDQRFAPVAALGIGGVVYYLIYALLGVPPYIWYYCPVIVALTVSMVLLLPTMLEHVFAGDRRRQLSLLVGGVLAVVVLAEAVVDAGHGGLAWREPVIVGNGAPSADYARIGRAVRAEVGDANVAAPAEIGALAFFCECAMTDFFSDRGLVNPLVNLKERKASFAESLLLRMNYLRLDRRVLPRLPAYYLELRVGLGKDPRWNTHSSVSRDHHFALVRSPVKTAVVTRLVDQIHERVPLDRRPVLLDLMGNTPTRLYLIALAQALARNGVDVRLHYGADPRLMVATGEDIDNVLKNRAARLVAYGGSVSWSRRAAIKRREKVIEAEHDVGTRSNLGTFVALTELRAEIRNDVAVLSVSQ